MQPKSGRSDSRSHKSIKTPEAKTHKKWSSRRRREIFTPITREQFLQANLKLIISPFSDSRQVCFINPNEMMNWDDVLFVTIYNNNNTNGSEAISCRCPICLGYSNDIRFPVITRCGHFYCIECILQFLSGFASKPCPVCKSDVLRTHLRPVSIHTINCNNGVEFKLVRCLESSIRPFTDSMYSSVYINMDSQSSIAAGDASSLPFDCESASCFARVAIGSSDTIRSLFEGESAAYSEIMMSCTNDMSAGFLAEAVTLLETRKSSLVNQYNSLLMSSTSSSRQSNDLQFNEMLEHVSKMTRKRKRMDSKAEFDRQVAIQNNQIIAPPSPSRAFYQLSSGDLVFMDPYCLDILLREYADREELLPQVVSSVHVIDQYSIRLDADKKRKEKFEFLSHIPLMTDVVLMFIDVSSYLQNKDSLTAFQTEVNNRSRAAQEKRIVSSTPTTSRIDLSHCEEVRRRVRQMEIDERNEQTHQLLSGPVVGELIQSDIQVHADVKPPVSSNVNKNQTSSFATAMKMGGNFPSLADAVASSKSHK